MTTTELMDLAHRLRYVRRMERYFLKQWAADRIAASPTTLDRVAADVRQTAMDVADDGATGALDLSLMFESADENA